MGEIIQAGFSGRDLPFYGLPSSKVVSGTRSAEDALKLAGLDWTVGLTESFYRVGDQFVEVEGTRFTYRQDTNHVFGPVGTQYAPFQNADAFGFADELLGFGVEFDAAVSWHGGAQVALTAKLPNGIRVEGEEDLDLYLLLRNSHNGACAITAMVTPIRISCTNMLNLAAQKAVSSIKIRHTRTAADRISEAMATLRLVDSYTESMQDIAKQLQEVQVGIVEFEELLNEITESNRVKDSMISVWQESPTVDRRTGWGAINAIGEALEYFPARTTGAESRFASNLDGPIARTRNRATELLLRRR